MAATAVGNTITRSVDIISVILLYGMLVGLTVGILSRQVTMPFRVPNALLQLMNVWIVFLLLANLELEERHINIDMFVEATSERIQRLIGGMNTFILIAITGVLIYSGLLSIQHFSGATIPVLGLPTTLLPLAAVVGMILLLGVVLIDLYRRRREAAMAVLDRYVR